MQSPGEQHAAWFREMQCENALRSVHDNLYKMEEYAVHASAEAYAGGVSELHSAGLLIAALKVHQITALIVLTAYSTVSSNAPYLLICSFCCCSTFALEVLG